MPGRKNNFGSAWFLLVTVVCFLTLSAGAQNCAGNPNSGCLHAGAACSSADVPHGHCANVPNLPKVERECECAGPAATPTPPVVVHPKFIVAAIVYAPPGCAGPTPNAPCSQPGLVDYTSGSSMGSKVTIADSFKEGFKITAGVGNEITGGSEVSFGWNGTIGDTKSLSLTKSTSLEIKVPGNGDGIDHDQDLFELLLHPSLAVSSNGSSISWQPTGPLVRYEVYASELRNPASMRPAVARDLAQAGLTAADFKTIRCLDPFVGPGVGGRGPGGNRPDFCQQTTATTGATSPGLDLNRFRPTTYILPYEPQRNAADLCPSLTPTLKNEYASERASSSQDEYSVSATANSGGLLPVSLKAENSITWTSGETDTNTQGSTQSASLTLVCPSVGYTGPTEFQIFVDVLYGTFLFVPFDLSTMAVMHSGVVLNGKGQPLSGVAVDLAYNGRTFHTFTSSTGRYRFVSLKSTVNPAVHKGTITVRHVSKQVMVGSANPITVRLP